MKNLIKSILPLGILLALCLTTIAQESTSQATPKIGISDYLLVKRGFKIFKLGDPIDKYNKYIKFLGEDSVDKIYKVIAPQFLSIGENLKLDQIYLRAYKDKIQEITILVNDQNKSNFFSTLLTAYGHSKKPNKFSEIYTWTSPDGAVSLSYNAAVPAKLGGGGGASFKDMELEKQKERDMNAQLDNNAGDI